MSPESGKNHCLSKQAQATLTETLKLASSLEHLQAGPEHLLLALFLTPGVPAFVLRRTGLDARDVWNELNEIPARPPATADAKLPSEHRPSQSSHPMSPALATTLREATALAQQAGLDEAQHEHLLRAVLSPASGPAARLLRRRGAKVDGLVQAANLFVSDTTTPQDPSHAASPREANRLSRRLALQVALRCGASTSAAATLSDVLSDLGPRARRMGVFALSVLLGWVLLSPLVALYRALGLANGDFNPDIPQLVAVAVVNATLVALLVFWALPRLWRWMLVTRLREREAEHHIPVSQRLRLVGELILLQRADQAVDLLCKLAGIMGLTLEPDEQLDATTAFAVSGPVRPTRRLAAWERTHRAAERIQAAMESLPNQHSAHDRA